MAWAPRIESSGIALSSSPANCLEIISVTKVTINIVICFYLPTTVSLVSINYWYETDLPCKLHAFGVKVLHFTCSSRTDFPYIFYKFTHFCFSCSPYISLKLWQLQLRFMHFTYSNLAAMMRFRPYPHPIKCVFVWLHFWRH